MVLALTNKLSRNAKDVAFNTLAHYNSQVGYSYATLPTIAVECGLSAGSVQTVRKAFDEIIKVGAFKIIKRPPTKGSKKSGAHHCCPNMPWFRAEYKLLQKSDRADPFEDMRERNAQGLEPHQIGLQTPFDRVGDPIRQGCEPYKENRTKRTEINEQIEESADGALTGVVSDRQKSRVSAISPANDNEAGRWPDDGFDLYFNIMPKQTKKDRARKSFDQLARSGVVYEEFMRSALNYSRYTSNEDPKFFIDPVNFIDEGRYKDNWPKLLADKRKSRRSMAI